jgi:outer membrane protein assembly factor BamB
MKTIILSFVLFFSFAYSQYSYTVENAGGARRAGETNQFRMSVHNAGKTVYTIERTIPFDVPYPLISFEEMTGMTVLRYVFDGFIEVYHPNGKKIWEYSFFKDEEPNYERTIGSVIGKWSIYFLVSDAYREKALVYQFAPDGVLRWTATLPHQYAYEIAISENEETIIAGSYLALEDEVRQSSALLNYRGEMEGNIDILFRKAVFSGDGRFIALSSEREAVIVSRSSGQEIARTKKQSDGIITDMIWSGNTLLVQESNIVTPNDGRFYYTDPTVFTYLEDLKIISRKRIDGVKFWESSLRQNGKTVELVLDKGKSVVVVE